MRRPTEFARQMRLNPTRPEWLLWQKLRGKKLGVKFRRQHPLMGYVLDFYCHELRLGIELDGAGHNPKRDKWRDSVISEKGVTVLRFANVSVLNDGLSVLDAIKSTIQRLTTTAGGGTL